MDRPAIVGGMDAAALSRSPDAARSRSRSPKRRGLLALGANRRPTRPRPRPPRRGSLAPAAAEAEDRPRPAHRCPRDRRGAAPRRTGSTARRSPPKSCRGERPGAGPGDPCHRAPGSAPRCSRPPGPTLRAAARHRAECSRLPPPAEHREDRSAPTIREPVAPRPTPRSRVRDLPTARSAPPRATRTLAPRPRRQPEPLRTGPLRSTTPCRRARFRPRQHPTARPGRSEPPPPLLRLPVRRLRFARR